MENNIFWGKGNGKYFLLALLFVALVVYFFLRVYGVNSLPSSSDSINHPSNIDVLTYHYNNTRTGANDKEGILTLANVNSKTFGKLFSIPVDGAVYAQPLLKNGILYIATEHDSVYAFKVSDGTELWHDSFISETQGTTTVSSADVLTQAIYPEIGITGTPVIDSDTNTLYVVSEYKKISAGAPAKYVQELHALDLFSGKEKSGGPTVITATAMDNTGKIITFDTLWQLQRGALLLENGVVYIAWASNGDNGPYHGWILAYLASDIKNQLGAWNDTVGGKMGGIWMAGGGISSDGKYLYAAVGNGDFDPTEGNYGDSVLRFALDVSKQFNVLDYFSPSNQAFLDANDLDLGTSDVLVLPDSKLVTADKAGTVYILDGNNLGKYNPGGDAVLQEIKTNGSILNNIAYFDDKLYVGDLKMSTTTYMLRNNIFRKTSQTKNIFNLGMNPVISANGPNNAILWGLDNSTFKTLGPTILYAYDANDLSRKLYASTDAGTRDQAGGAVKFTAPLVANGYVYVGADKEVDVYGLLK